MRNLLLALFFSIFVVPVSGDELSDINKEFYPLKREVKKMLSETNRFKNPEWKEANMASIRAKAAVGKIIDEHSDLEAIRQKLAFAKKAYDDVRESDDKELIKQRLKEKRDLDGKLHREAFKLREVQEAQAASVQARRRVEALEYAMIAELNAEAKEKVAKFTKLEERRRELLKAKEEEK